MGSTKHLTFSCLFVFLCSFVSSDVYGTAIDGDMTSSSFTIAGPVSISSLTTSIMTSQAIVVSTLTVNSQIFANIKNSSISIQGITVDSITVNSKASITGTKTNDNAAPGNLGEYTVASVTSASAPLMSSSIYTDISSITLTAGDWDVTGVLSFVTSGSCTAAIGALSRYSGNSTTDLVGGFNSLEITPPGTVSGNVQSLSIPNWRVSLSASATIYLKAYMNFSGGSNKAYGRIDARRLR